MPLFTPPTRYQRIPTHEKPFKFYQMPVSMGVVLRNGHFTEVRYFAEGEVDNLTEGEQWFAGGRTYRVSDNTALLLQADGFTTQPESGLPFI